MSNATNATPIVLAPSALIAKYNLQSKADQYFKLLMQENEKVNLVSRETSDAGFIKLFAESILPLEMLEGKNFQNYLDIGSGGGFPSIPLLLSERAAKATLIERTGKKAKALENLTTGLGLSAKVIAQNFEEVKFNHKFSLVTLRYVTLTKLLNTKIESVLEKGGVFIYYSSILPNLMLPQDGAVSRETFRYHISGDQTLFGFTIFKKR